MQTFYFHYKALSDNVIDSDIRHKRIIITTKDPLIPAEF